MNVKSGLFEILAKIRSNPGMYLGKPSIDEFEQLSQTRECEDQLIASRIEQIFGTR